MDSKVKSFIESGILEAYVTGSATEVEEQEVLFMKQHCTEVEQELASLEKDLERIAHLMAVPPPPNVWDRIEADINGIVRQQAQQPEPQARTFDNDRQTPPTQPHYIEVDAQNTHMRVHKAWRWVFAAVFVLGKIFLAFAIYFYLENRQAQENLKELIQQLKQTQNIKQAP